MPQLKTNLCWYDLLVRLVNHSHFHNVRVLVMTVVITVAHAPAQHQPVLVRFVHHRHFHPVRVIVTIAEITLAHAQQETVVLLVVNVLR